MILRASSAGWQLAVNLSERHGSGNTGDTPLEFLWVNLKRSVFGSAQGDTDHQQHYPNIPTEAIFENDRVLVQRYVMQPGEWEGIHTHSGNQLYIMLTDGQWTARHGDQEKTSVSSAGLVDWQRAVDLSEEHESGNTGDTPLEFLWVNLKQ